MTTFLRNTQSRYKFGCHVSTAGGIAQSILNANKIGCQSFAMFMNSPRRWNEKNLTNDEIDEFKLNCEKYNYNPETDILPHGHYFINLCNPDLLKADKAFGLFINEITNCEKLGIKLYNLHPGSALKGGNLPLQIKQLANFINKAHDETSTIKIVLENMSGKDNVIGNKLEDLRDLIELVDNKDRIGVCIDTCHTYASGYDISTEIEFNKFWTQFDEIIGFKYLNALHLNDSKAPLNSKQDLHERLGQGFLGLETFRLIANDKRFEGIPLILETPYKDNDNIEGYGKEIQLLHWLETINSEDNKELVEKDLNLQKLGEKTRSDQQAKYDKKMKALTNGVKRSASRSKSGGILEQLSKRQKT